MNYYLVSEEDLINLIADHHRLCCLYEDGVDNWEYFMDGRKWYIADYLQKTSQEVIESDLNFKDCAISDLSRYTKVEEGDIC